MYAEFLKNILFVASQENNINLQQMQNLPKFKKHSKICKNYNIDLYFQLYHRNEYIFFSCLKAKTWLFSEYGS